MKRQTSTKEKILYILKKDVTLPIKEIMDYFTISEVAVRRHLNDLIHRGFVQEQTVKQEIGRPYHLYSLTKKGHKTFPNQYEQLPLELLKDLEQLQGKKVVNELLLKRQEREKQELSAHLEEGNFKEKIKKFAEAQEEKGYMLEYEQLANGDIEMKNFNCPIYNIAAEYNQVCTNEKEMFKTLFPESAVVPKSCMTAGGKYCIWLFTKPEEKMKR